MRFQLASPLALALACTADPVTPADSPQPAESFGPEDSAQPGDSPTAEDSAAGPAFSGLAGLVTGFGQDDCFTTVCDLEIALQGSPAQEPCEGCDLDLDMQAEVLEDRGLAICQPSPLLSWLPSGAYSALRLAWAEEVQLESWGQLGDALLTGYALTDVGYELPGPSWMPVAHDGHAYGSAEREGDLLRWTWEEEVYTVAPRAYNLCSWIHSSLASQALEGDYRGESGLSCQGEVMDVWSFEAAGQTDLTVDTVSADSAADLALLLNDAETQCTLFFANDNHGCSHSPSAGGCPSLRAALPEERRSYHAVVMSLGSCTGGTVSYSLRVDADEDPQLQLSDDDYPVFMVDMQTRVQAWGELQVGP